MTQRQSYGEILLALPYLTHNELQTIYAVIEQLYPSVRDWRQFNPTIPDDDFEAKSMRRLQNALDAVHKVWEQNKR